MNAEEILIKLQSIPYTTAYTGELNNIKQGSYIRVVDINKLMYEIKKSLKTK